MTIMHLYEFLQSNQIGFQRYDHPAVYTCEEAALLVPDLPGIATKNLFVIDKKNQKLFLLVVPDTKSIDLKALSHMIDCRRLSMGSAEDLRSYLGVEPGSVSVLSLFCDQAAKVNLVVDEQIWLSEAVQCHPLVNTSTLVLGKQELKRFLAATGHVPQILNVPTR
jgi:Ala-tRNA(Pro) deacylase